MAWQCPACKDYVENGRISCTSCGTSRGGATSGPVRTAATDPRRDLAMEGHLRATAFWYRAFALVGGALLVLGWLRDDGVERSLIGSIVFAATCLGAFVIGSGLARLSSGARVFAGLLTLLGLGGTVLELVRGHGGGLIGTLISLAWSGAYVWLFFSSRSRAVTEPAYRLIVASSAAQKPRMLASPFFWLPLIGIAAVLLMFLVFFGLAGSLAFTG
jgi:hypothetical protein